ncbi:hypothetical protein LCGC14_1238000 [marine sediment metagenome]|uniref:Uncharacterized protein n=1 Tax=marine sediment metagenome TaxID=412755 RepID=A0A0F9NNV4_9ZZZZ
MRTIEVNNMYECPFMHEAQHQLSEDTTGVDTMCTLNQDACQQRNCPLKKDDEVRVIWKVN